MEPLGGHSGGHLLEIQPAGSEELDDLGDAFDLLLGSDGAVELLHLLGGGAGDAGLHQAVYLREARQVVGGPTKAARFKIAFERSNRAQPPAAREGLPRLECRSPHGLTVHWGLARGR